MPIKQINVPFACAMFTMIFQICIWSFKIMAEIMLIFGAKIEIYLLWNRGLLARIFLPNTFEITSKYFKLANLSVMYIFEKITLHFNEILKQIVLLWIMNSNLQSLHCLAMKHLDDFLYKPTVWLAWFCNIFDIFDIIFDHVPLISFFF